MRPASRGFDPRLFIRVRLRVYLPVDNGGALIGVSAICASSFQFTLPPSSKSTLRRVQFILR